MNCSEIRDLSPLWLSGELKHSQRSQFAEHLAECADCRRSIDEHIALDSRIRAAVNSVTFDVERVNKSVLARIGAGKTRPWLVWGAVAALALVSVFAGYRLRFKHELPRAFSDAARDHQAEVVEHRQRRWVIEPVKIAALAAKFGLDPAKSAALAPEGFHLLHAKTCGIEGSPVLHLVYTDGAREVSLYVRQAGTAVIASEAAVTGTEQLASARASNRSVVVVTSGSADECLHFALRAAALL